MPSRSSVHAHGKSCETLYLLETMIYFRQELFSDCKPFFINDFAPKTDSFRFVPRKQNKPCKE